ncbi:hypothetical protein SFC55_25235 [Niallia taxi]|uniref:hypothetical protein n=1 Tax=Niallia taxi TaxID=2499688 RepID=UPI003981E370
MKESELFEPVKKFLLGQGCTDVYGEVMNCDVLGINGEINYIVEMKTSLSFKVIDQAMERVRLGHYIFIAIPKRKQAIPRCVKEILEAYDIGLIQIGKRKTSVTIPAQYNNIVDNRNGYKRIRNRIREHHQTQLGGIKKGEGVTAYSTTMDNIRAYMRTREGEWITVDEILANCTTHYKKPKSSVAATLQKKWNKSWCETKLENRRRYYRIKVEMIQSPPSK